MHRKPETETTTLEYPCDSCSYKAINSNDLRRHQVGMHKKPLKCNNCEFESLNPHDGTHVREEHRLPRTFHSRQMDQTTRNGKFRNFESASSTSRPEASSQTSPTEGRGPTSSSRPETSSNTSSTEDRESPKYHCQGSCSSLQKTFDKQDELELHMEFYHKEQQ